jgi:hypothetical protein
VIGLSGTGAPFSGNIGSWGLEEIFCLKLSTKFGFDCPLKSPSASEAVNRFPSVSLGNSGVGVDARAGVYTGAGDGVILGTGVCIGAGFCVGAGAGTGVSA